MNGHFTNSCNCDLWLNKNLVSVSRLARVPYYKQHNKKLRAAVVGLRHRKKTASKIHEPCLHACLSNSMEVFKTRSFR
jgi:hypothetical protein